MFLLPHHVQNFFLINWLMINWHKKMKLAKEKKMAPKNATMKGDWCWSILILFQSRGGRGKEPPKLTLQTRKIDYSFQAHWERECLCVCVWRGRERESQLVKQKNKTCFFFQLHLCDHFPNTLCDLLLTYHCEFIYWLDYHCVDLQVCVPIFVFFFICEFWFSFF